LIGGSSPFFTADALGALLEIPPAPLVQPVHPLPTTGLPGPLMPDAFGASRTSAVAGVSPVPGEGDCPRAARQDNAIATTQMPAAIAGEGEWRRMADSIEWIGIG
jgi:hypothetical protein